MFMECEHVHYAKAQLAEVICQLRFPTILRIGASEPADFRSGSGKTIPAIPAMWKSSRPS